MDYCLIYLSSSSRLLSEDEISHIVYQSQTNNRALNITGVLLYCNGSFIQVLEGDKKQVKALYEVISRDTRHAHLTRLYGAHIENRTFSDWLMGYRTLTSSEFNHLHEHLSYIRNPFLPKAYTNTVTMSMVQRIYINNYRN